MSWEWLLQPAIALLALIGIIGVNIAIWIFAWGMSRGRTNTRLNVIEEKLDNPRVLPECTETFTEIKQVLSEVSGKVDAILAITTAKGKRRKTNEVENGS